MVNIGRSLTFSWSYWSLALSVIALVSTAAFGIIAWRRSGYARSMAYLELVRFLLVFLAVIVLNQPEWTELFRPEEMPTIAVLCDDSGSMDTKDVVAKGAASPANFTPRSHCAFAERIDLARFGRRVSK